MKIESFKKALQKDHGDVSSMMYDVSYNDIRKLFNQITGLLQQGILTET